MSVSTTAITNHSDLQKRIAAIVAEAAKYKTVRTSWLTEKLAPVLEAAKALDVEDRPLPVRTGPKPVSLLKFLAKRGGLKRDGDLIAMDAHRKLIPGAGMLVRKEGGQSLDYAREAAVEAGYLPEDADINTLLDAISDELHGRLVLSTPDAWDADLAGNADLTSIPF